MIKRILVIGGYGNFGSYISKRLASQTDIKVIIAGRNGRKAEVLANAIGAEWAEMDVSMDVTPYIEKLKPDIVIHTSGPFQGQGYGVALSCIKHKCHYIDLADGREFVVGISGLNQAAKDAGVVVVSGASSVPALTSAIIDRYISEFKSLDKVTYGIATGQRTSRGLATTKAVLSYAGKPFQTMIDGAMKTIYGWQSIHLRNFDELGWRFLGNCDVPDLSLFPVRYPTIKTIRFYAGLELPFMHITLWFMTWLVRIKLIKNLATVAELFLKTSYWFDFLGTDKSAFYMEMTGTSKSGGHHQVNFDLVARKGDGPLIPCTPAIAMALKLAEDTSGLKGAMPCMGILNLDDILNELRPLNITWKTSMK
jgi:saccharopine dehydrogenase-like NADP-dependent oxidoreductase